MNKGQGHGRLHGLIAAAALSGLCYLTKYEFSGLKGIHQTYVFALKTVANTKVRKPSRPRAHNCVNAIIVRCIYVVAA